MILAYLIFAHLLGDFVFQPSALVKWKMKSMWGTLTHVAVHFLVNLFILLPFIINGYFELIYFVLGICFIHFWIDEAKINYDLKHDLKVRPFVIDQLLHMFTILVANFFLMEKLFVLPGNTFYKLYANINIIIFLSFLVVVSTVIEVYNLQKEREKNSNTNVHIDSKNMLSRIIVFTLLYSLFMFVTFLMAK